ncbi:hypothetical protein SAMN05216232_2194 [Virgibacillus subterraneus]|uniref:Uncharacterized protein n=1 Tax=Virgibacillus subterraneus TaxID=621109 RepID=A0A1H9FGF6_9BACI|nr:hypothetical protein [Virgibacillus subterraneus]SEQ36979.1 hypothetical protein SAMN05216232_2194 [Virgibacillus subterraneus]
MNIRKVSVVLGITAGISSIVLWFVLNFYNPYSNPTELAPVVNTFFMLFLPACLAIVASFMSKQLLLLIAFLWSLPVSLYLVFSPGIFALFGISSIAYLISYLLVRLANPSSLFKKSY